MDGWVSLEVSPLLAHDTASTIRAAKDLFARAARPNLFIKIPGTKEGLPAIEEAIFAGIPVNVTLLFSREQYLAAAEAFLRGIERRLDAGRESQCRLRRLDLHQPLGRSGDAAKCPMRCVTSSALPSPSAPTRPTATCSTPRAGSGSTTPELARSGCCGPAREPRILRRPDVLYIKALGRAFHREHDAGGHVEGARRTYRTRSAAAGRRRRLRGSVGGVRARPEST